MSTFINNLGKTKDFFLRKKLPDNPIEKLSKVINFYGDFAELHDRIIGLDGDFDNVCKILKESSAKNESFKIVIGLSRYNFARLNKIIELCISLMNKSIDLLSLRLSIFPVKYLADNFQRHLEAVRSNINSDVIEIDYFDKELTEILKTVSMHAQLNPGKDKDLLRLLGVISEQVFIGPQTIVFDPFHRCNTKCKHCWVHTPSIKQPEEFLDRKFDFELFEKIIDDASKMSTDGIILQGDGEPLMYDKFMPMLRYARNKGLGVLFFTNGILLDEQKAKEIIDLGVNEIYCSLPAGSPQVFEKVSSIQPGDTFYKIRDNLKRLMALRRKSGKDLPRLIVSHVIHNMNYHELIEMAKTDVEISPDAVRFYLIRLDTMNRFLQLKPEEIMKIKEQIPEISKLLEENRIELIDNFDFQLDHYDIKTGAWSKDYFLKHGCTIGWYFNLIPAKYDMSFCCHLRTVGYLDKKSFSEIWNSMDYWSWRRKAKYLGQNKKALFANGQVLYDEHCDHCDNHQTIIRVLNELRLYGLYRYY